MNGALTKIRVLGLDLSTGSFKYHVAAIARLGPEHL
mgnify:CR=1 FL=1